MELSDLSSSTNMEVEEMQEELERLNRTIAALIEQREDLRQKIVEAAATFAVGDRVTYEGAKDIWQITSIRPGYVNEPRYFGAKIKKDGSPSVVSRELWTPFSKRLGKI